MACTTNNTTKPDVTQRPSNFYGAPQGQAGRTFSVDYGVQGIVLHCTDMTISQYVQYLACLTQPVSGVKQEVNHHYSIGSAGALNQHIDDGNLSWTFGAYQGAIYTEPPTPTITIQWPTLQNLNGVNVSPDTYVINILIAKSYNQGTSCLTASGLPKDQHEKLIQLLAYLSATYEIPLDADHINWHDNIATQACPSNECNCTDIACLLTDINTFCEEDCNTVTYSEVECTDVSHLLAIPNNCGNSSGCLVSIPLDNCCFGSLPVVGEVEQFVGVATDTATGALCLVKNDLQVTSPITGLGTTANPLAIDSCEFGSLAPTGTVLSVIGFDDQGCLASSLLSDSIVGDETPLTVIDTSTVNLTAGGVNGHELTASVKLSTADGNILTADDSGLFVSFACDDLSGLFETGVIVNLYGADSGGDCVLQDVDDVVNAAICANPIADLANLPMHLLGRAADLSCPVFFVPGQIIEAGLTTLNKATVDLTLTTNPSVLSAEVNIDPADDNVIQVTSEGLYVAPIQVQATDNCLDVQVVNGIIQISHIISPEADNILTCAPNGLYAQDITAVDTACLDLEFNSTTREISGSIILAPDQGGVSNVAQCIDSQGFYVPRGANLLVNGPLIGDGSEIAPLDIDFAALDNEDLCDLGGVIPQTLNLVDVVGRDASGCLRRYTGEEFINQFLEIDNGDCITATLTGNVLNIEPVISPPIGAVNNVLSCNSTGLYVPQGAGILPQATNCIALQLVNGVLTATPILDPDALNQLSCNVDGLYVEQGAGVTGGTTNCIQVVATQGQITATPIVSGAILGVDNVLSCEAGGLFVPAGAGLTPVITDCIDVVFDTATGELIITPIISPLVNNVLECTVNGLYVPAGADDFIQFVSNTNCIALDVTGDELTATPIIDPDSENILSCGANGLIAQFAIADSLCIDLQLNAGILTADVIVDPSATNLLTCGVNGLLVEFSETLTSVDDTDCIELEINAGVLTANPILAPDQGAITNILQCIPGQGLYVPVGGGITTLDGSCVSLGLVTGVLTAEVIIDNVTPDNAITCGPDGLYVAECCPIVQDTATVNLTLATPRTITADIIIDPDGTNILVSNPNGLYVPPPFITAAIDSNCMDIEVVGGVLTISPIISAQADNTIQCLGDGLYAPECCPLVTDTDSVDLTLTGTRTISADVVIDPDVNNALSVSATGLFVPTAFITDILDSQCMDLDVTGGVLSITPIISPLADNLLVCQGDGLYVPPLVAVDSNCLDVDITGGTITVNPIISAQAENAIQCLADGFFVQECCPLVTDTLSINLTLTGLRTISADVIVDPDVTNTLVVNANGLFVPTPFITAVSDHQCLDLDVTGGILTITPIIDPAADNTLTCGIDGLYSPALSVVDSNCIDLDITGNVLTANPIISAQPDNAIDCLGDGLFVQDCCPLVLDTPTVNLTLTGLRTISADVIIDPLADNVLVANAAGLYVPEPFVTDVADTNCITLTETAGVLTADPVINPQPNNIIQCLGDGLFAQAPVVTVADTDCMTLALDGAGELTASPIISPALDNALQCNGDGLFVLDCCIAEQDTTTVDLTLANNVLTADVIVSPLADNVLVAQGDGLYVPPMTVVDSNCLDLDITNNVLTADITISAVVDNQFQCLGDGVFVAKGAGLDVLDTDCFDFSITDGVLTGSPIISQNADNALSCEPDGLYVPDCCLTEADTTSVDLTITANVLTADVIVSPLGDNILVSQGDGLYVPQLVVNDTACMALDITGGALTATPIIDPVATNQLTCGAAGLLVEPITAVDSNCIDVDLTNNVLTINPILSATADNQIDCIADGFYVPQAAGLQVLDTNCIDLTIVAGILSADPIMSANADNIITCEADGLYVPDDFIQAIANTNCITLSVINGVLTVDPILSATADNQMQCIGDGLYVPQGGGLVGIDTNCLSTTVANGEVSVDPILAPIQGGIANSLVCLPDGLYVPAGADLVVIDGNCVDLTLTNGNILQAEVIIDPAADNLVTCVVGNGLYVAPMTGVDTNCIDIDITNNVLTINPIIAPAQAGVENILTCLVDGLYVPETVFTRNIGATPAGNNTIDVDTDGDGFVDFTFCEGFDTIDIENDCPIGGVGADYMLRQFEIADKILTVNSAPEHISVCGHSSGNLSLPGNAHPAAVNEVIHAISGDVIIENTSLCRDLIVQIVATGNVSVYDPDAGVGLKAGIRVRKNGAPYVGQSTRLISPAPAGVTSYGMAVSVTQCDTLAPGEIATYASEMTTSNETLGAFGSGRSEGQARISVMGSTT